MPHHVRFCVLALVVFSPSLAVNAQETRSLTIESGRTVVLSGRESWQQILVTGRYADAKTRDLTREVRYESMPAGVVVVDANGLVTPIKEGATTLHAKLGALSASVQVVVKDIETERPIHFENQIVPIFTRFGCNAGGCHGKAGGQNGFQLSLLGFEPQEDFEFIVKEARGRRLLLSAPEYSLLLTKATGLVPHGGGKRLELESAYYRLLLRWVKQGAPPGRTDDPVVSRIEVLPKERVLARESAQQLTVIAHHSDGSSVDVTRLAQFEPNHPELAVVSNTGLVTAKTLPGSVAIMARYQTHVAVFQALIPLGLSLDSPAVKSKTLVDDHVFGQLKRLGVPPSDACSDAAFLRRVTLDLSGRLPSLEETKEYLADAAKDKDAKLIDRLLASEDHAYYFAGKWGTILRNRRTNPADDIKPTFAFHGWIKDSLHANKPFDQFARDILTAAGEDTKVPQIVWYREVKEASAQVEDVAQLFLGQRVGCAKCHHHPFEKWTQDDYWSMVACFSQVEIKIPALQKKGKESIKPPATVTHKPGVAKAVNPRTKQTLKPSGLGGPKMTLDATDDPRAKLADWMVAPDNPFFARTLANRYWKHFFKIGLVEPEDDLRLTNPASNPELLDALAKHFVDSKYDLKSLIRVICNSHAYRLSAIPNAHNADDKQNFSHFYLRRLHAEVLFDAIDVVTGSKTTFKGLPEGTRAVQLPDNQFQSYFLSIFGRPDSASPCECERGSDATLVQSLYLFNSDDLLGKIRGRVTPSKTLDPKAKNPPKGLDPNVITKSAGGRILQLASDKRPDSEKVRELYLIALSREPRAEELRTVLAYLDARRDDLTAAYEDVLWAVINTKEFLFNH